MIPIEKEPPSFEDGSQPGFVVYQLSCLNSSAVSPMGPNELLAAVSPAPVGADENGTAIRTWYAEADR